MSYLAVSILVYVAYVLLSLFIVAAIGVFWRVPLFVVAGAGFVVIIGLIGERSFSLEHSELHNPLVLKNSDNRMVRVIVLKKTMMTEQTGAYMLRPSDVIVLNSMTGGFRVLDESRSENIVGDSSPKLLSVK